MQNFTTIEVINFDKEPVILKKENKIIAVSLELMDKKYVVGFDVINEENMDDFDMNKHEYETIGLIETYSQEGGFIDCRNDLIKKLDEMTIEQFQAKYF